MAKTLFIIVCFINTAKIGICGFPPDGVGVLVGLMSVFVTVWTIINWIASVLSFLCM